MLFEQAFYTLPEILHGSGYQKQDYEAGIINAFTLSVLQVLNGRNVNNPIGCIQTEKLYRKRGRYSNLDKPRYLRADLYIDVSKLFVANRRLSQYGWRHNLWLEGKFLRRQTGPNYDKHCGNKTNYVAQFLADIIRLSTLIPEDNKYSSVGRYFLHVYDAHPQYYLTFRSRAWCKKLCLPGNQEIKLLELNKEKQSVIKLLGDLGDIKLRLKITNSISWPLSTNNRPIYWFCLTRIDEIHAEQNKNNFSILSNRCIEKSSQNSIQDIASFVADRLHIQQDSSESFMPIEEDDEELENDDQYR